MTELEVRDYGPGILAADLPFESTPFYQVPQGNMTRQGGMGLGLYIVQQLVQAHGGKVEVRSPEGRGTTVTIWLPLATAEQMNSKGASTQAKKSARNQDTSPHSNLTEGR